MPAFGPHVGSATTGLVSPWLPGGWRIWEIGLIRRELDGTERTSHVFVRRADVSMGHAPREQLNKALEVGRYHERYPEVAGLPMDGVYTGEQAAQIVAAVTARGQTAQLSDGQGGADPLGSVRGG